MPSRNPCASSSMKRYRLLPCCCARSLVVAPGEDDADVPGHAAGKVDDLTKNPIAARLQVVRPELMDFAGNAGQSPLPAGLPLIDGAAAIGAQRIGKTVDLHLAEAVSDGALDHRRRELNFLVF